MLFFALLLIFFNLYGLVKGKMFYDISLEYANLEIKKARGEIKEIPKETNVKLFFIGLWLLIYILIEFIFIINSLNRDPYLFPTLSVIVYIFLQYLFNSLKKKKDLTTEEGRAKFLINSSKRYSFFSFINKLVFITYFGYMFAVLLGLVK